MSHSYGKVTLPHLARHLGVKLFLYSESLSGKHAEAIADPKKYQNLFSDFDDSLRAEKFYSSVSTVRIRFRTGTGKTAGNPVPLHPPHLTPFRTTVPNWRPSIPSASQ